MTQAWDDPPPAREIVEAWLDRVRPALVADGGNIELVAIDHDGTVQVSMQGTCADCPAQLATLRVGIEEPLKQAVRGVRSVIAIDVDSRLGPIETKSPRSGHLRGSSDHIA